MIESGYRIWRTPSAARFSAASIVALLPANNLAGPALFDFAAPNKALNAVHDAFDF